jgi:acylphosphatase
MSARPMACVRFIVSGRVQGVFFRASTRDEALRLGLRGHARNLADGRVEVVARGDDSALADLERWLQVGPPLARVTGVERLAASEATPEGFRLE